MLPKRMRVQFPGALGHPLAARLDMPAGPVDIVAECRRLGMEIRRVGSNQDAAMARARMGLRWLRQQARSTESPWAAKVGSRIDDALSTQ